MHVTVSRRRLTTQCSEKVSCDLLSAVGSDHVEIIKTVATSKSFCKFEALNFTFGLSTALDASREIPYD